MTRPVPDNLWPLTQENADALFDWVSAPWVKEMGA